MKILVYSNYSAQTISANFGKAEYSYYFVLAGYLPALSRLGEVVNIADPGTEVDVIFDACAATGEDCVFLCFTPPHLVPINLRCPTIPVFAWEFLTIPCEVWGDDPRCDWRVVFAHCGRAITLSNHAATLVRDAMGEDFPIFCIPTASYDAFAETGSYRSVHETAVLKLRGYLFDSALTDRFSRSPAWPPVPAPAFTSQPVREVVQPVAPVEPAPPQRSRPTIRKRFSITVYYARAWYHEVLRDVLPDRAVRLVAICTGFRYRVLRGLERLYAWIAPSAPIVHPEYELTLSGVVYTSVFAPQDGRKNWQDLLSGFFQAFRDNAEATLFVKMPVLGGVEAYPAMHMIAGQFAPFKCRVIFFAGFLDDDGYRELARATTYYVNTSHGEGLCLPLMEFLSAGRPAIAPDHTAMADYIASDIAFVLKASQEHNIWPFDKRDLFKTMRYRLDWESLVSAYEQSYVLAVERGPDYVAKCEAAKTAMREFCAADVVQAKLAEALGVTAPAAQIINARTVIA